MREVSGGYSECWASLIPRSRSSVWQPPMTSALHERTKDSSAGRGRRHLKPAGGARFTAGEAADGIRTHDLLHGKQNVGPRASHESPAKQTVCVSIQSLGSGE